MDGIVLLLSQQFKFPPKTINACLGKVGKKYSLPPEDIAVIVSVNYLELLPDELLMGILVHVDLEELLAFCLVSRRIHVICEDEVFWKRRIKEEFGPAKKEKGKTYKQTYQKLSQRTLTVMMFFEYIEGILYVRPMWQGVSTNERKALQKLRKDFPKGLSLIVPSGKKLVLTSRSWRKLIKNQYLPDIPSEWDFISILSQRVPKNINLGDEVYLLLYIDLDNEVDVKVFSSTNQIKTWIAEGHLSELAPEIEATKRGKKEGYEVPGFMGGDPDFWSYKKTAQYLMSWLTFEHDIPPYQIEVGDEGHTLNLFKTSFEDHIFPKVQRQ